MVTGRAVAWANSVSRVGTSAWHIATQERVQPLEPRWPQQSRDGCSGALEMTTCVAHASAGPATPKADRIATARSSRMRREPCRMIDPALDFQLLIRPTSRFGYCDVASSLNNVAHQSRRDLPVRFRFKQSLDPTAPGAIARKDTSQPPVESLRGKRCPRGSTPRAKGARGGNSDHVE